MEAAIIGKIPGTPGVLWYRCLSDDLSRLYQREVEEVMTVNEVYSTLQLSNNPIRLENLNDVINSHKQSSGGFQAEFERLPMGLLASTVFASKTANKSKNRFNTVLPYDKSRFILNNIIGEPESDYINASYIRGSTVDNTYIAAQGPMNNTIDDFWRLIWQSNCHIIVMLTNVVENMSKQVFSKLANLQQVQNRVINCDHPLPSAIRACGNFPSHKNKCSQYWPDAGTKTFENIEATTTECHSFLNFIIRKFNVRNKVTSEERTVCQFHFTDWQDHEVPEVDAMLSFLHRVDKYNTSIGVQHPLLVHCSAGVGRTGTFIALASLLNQARAENKVDILGIVHQMRAQRTNMVYTVDQYAFLYEALLGSIIYDEVCVPVGNFMEAYGRWTSAQSDTKYSIKNQFHILEEKPSNNTGPSIESIERRTLNMSSNIEPFYIDSYIRKYAYLIVPIPVSDSKSEFWRMVHDHKVTLIIELQKPSEPYIPVVAEHSECEGLLLSTKSISMLDTNVAETIVEELRQQTGETRTVQVLQTKAWEESKTLPETEEVLLSLCKRLEQWENTNSQGNQSPVLVLCRDGVTCCGLFCLLTRVMQRIQHADEVNVFHATQSLKQVNPKFISSFEQYKYCYDAVAKYLDNNRRL